MPITGKMIPVPICAQLVHYPTSKTHTQTTTQSALFQPKMICQYFTVPSKTQLSCGEYRQVTLLDTQIKTGRVRREMMSEETGTAL